MCAPARDVAERTWGEEAVVYIDALLVFLKIVVGFWVKVGGFRTFSVIIQINNLFRGFILFRPLSLQMSDEQFLQIWCLLWSFFVCLFFYLIVMAYICG